MNQPSLDEQIEQETANIQQLEKSYPPPNTDERTERPDTNWWIHHTAVRDAYWRRRMLIAKRDGLPLPFDVY